MGLYAKLVQKQHKNLFFKSSSELKLAWKLMLIYYYIIKQCVRTH